jgi:hypothetical protein
MAAFFLRKKVIGIFTLLLSVLFVLLSFFYSVFLSQIKVVPVRERFYLLVAEELHVEAGAEFVKLEGGAGYLLSLDGKEYLLMSVYLKESEGESVRVALTGMGRAVRLLSVSVENLYFKGNEKSRANMYVSALNILKGYLSVVGECISKLDNGATQESIKRILTPMRSQLLYLSNAYKRENFIFSNLCDALASELYGIESEIIYVRDLRYLSCGIVDGYLQVCKKFAI